MLQLNMPLPEFLVWSDGEVRLRGRRIGVYDILKRHRRGEPADEIAEDLSSVSCAEIARVIAFYEAHRAALDAYLESFEEEARRMEATCSAVDVEELRQRFRRRYGHDLQVETVVQPDTERDA